MENKIIQGLKSIAVSVKYKNIGKKVIQTFKKVSLSVPAYKQILAKKGVRSESVASLENFERVAPILYKEDLFNEYSPKDLCVSGAIDSLASAIVSSGTSGAFAYKVITKHELDSEKHMVDRLFEMFFDASKIKTCIINALPMGVSFVSSYPVIPTSVRSDILWHVIKSFSQNLEQIVIIGDPNFIKKLIEEGRKTNFQGAVEKLKFVIGGDWSSASYFKYISGVLSAQNKDNLFGTFGITEIGLNIGMADNSLQKIREIIQSNKELQKTIFGIELKTAPALFFFDPERTYIEKINKSWPFSELAFTTLSDLSMPFVRYATGDYGTILNIETINKALENIGRVDLALNLPIPILAMTGRLSNRVDNLNTTITAEDVKQVLYSESKIAQNITGNFRLSADKSSFKVDIQLMKGIRPLKMQGLVKEAVKNLGKSVLARAVEYHKFPYNMSLDYESKWAYTKIK